jgi:glycosyltransferase involved in cell wall biosynthesis
MAERPDVSVIIPTRNRGAYLRQAVASVLAQLDCTVEILIVDDGNGVPAFADRRVVVLKNFERGPVPARNLGVERARAGIIAFLDDDDLWHDESHLAVACAAIKAGADFTFADGVLEYADGASSVPFSFDADEASLMKDNTILISAVCYRRSLHRQLGSFDEALPYYWDWDWYLRVARCGARLQRLQTSSVTIRVHAGNMSGKDAVAARRKNLDLLIEKHGLGAIELKNHASLARDAISRS